MTRCLVEGFKTSLSSPNLSWIENVGAWDGGTSSKMAAKILENELDSLYQRLGVRTKGPKIPWLTAQMMRAS